MLIKEDVFLKLCPSYQKAISKLENDNAALSADNHIRKIRIFKKFMNQYLVLPEIVDEISRLALNAPSEIRYSENVQRGRIAEKAMYHFYDSGYFSKLLHDIPDYYGRFCDDFQALDTVNPENFFPQKGMDRTFRFYEKWFCKPLPKDLIKKYLEAKNLYTEIVEAENDDQKWMDLIIQVDDDEFVINNIDYRLGKDLNNTELWKLYFQFLKNHDTKKLLNLYSRYCRYFLDDSKMKTEYEKAVEQYGPSIVHWENPFPFEKYEKEKYIFPKVNKKYNNSFKKPVLLYSSRDRIGQNFSLPKPILAYIKETKTPIILHKLHKSCKYFFSAQPYPVCYRLEISLARDTFIQCVHQQIGLYLGRGSLTVSFDQKLIISNTFDNSTIRNHRLSRYLISDIIKHIHLCLAKYIRIEFQDISKKEFKFLVGHGNVEVLHLTEVNILDETNGKQITLEEILKFVPRIVEFYICAPVITLQTYEILPTLEFVNKFEEFRMEYITYLEPHGFIEFMKKNFDLKTRFFGHVVCDLREQFSAACKTINNEVNILSKNSKPYSFELY